jgi:putative restriction endonuclease
LRKSLRRKNITVAVPAPILVTDHDWFEYLAANGPHDEVNFWRPSDKRKPSWAPGTPALFKLKKPYGGWIVGYGLFARHELVPAWLAWEAFGTKNGAADFAGMRDRIERLRRSTGARRSLSSSDPSSVVPSPTPSCF